jgi:hypothetical protein
MRYAEWATTPQRVEQTKQNTLRIVKAVVNYLTTASQAGIRIRIRIRIQIQIRIRIRIQI